MSDEGKTVKVTDSLLKLYDALDKHLEGVLQSKFKASCAKGCAHCCHLLATITFAEALLITEKLLVRPDWASWLPKLRAAAVQADYLGISRGNYFDKGYPCVFLGTDKLCQIYEDRPACCRYHVVSSPPEHCSYLAPPTSKTAMLDSMQMEEMVWQLSMDVVDQLNHRELMVGPMALMILACMHFITQNPAEDQDIADHSLINEACKGLRSPKQWMLECGMELAAKEDSQPPVRIELKDFNKETGK